MPVMFIHHQKPSAFQCHHINCLTHPPNLVYKLFSITKDREFESNPYHKVSPKDSPTTKTPNKLLVHSAQKIHKSQATTKMFLQKLNFVPKNIDHVRETGRSS